MLMRAGTIRSGLVEAEHPISAVAVDDAGRVLAAWGDPERTTFLRSAAKPFQATVSQESGAALPPEWLALACASHGGQPVHLAVVRAMLDEVGLSPAHLRCPPAWPLSEGARDRAVAAGHRHPARLFHNCSGKHAAMLRACRAQGWPEDTYPHPDHPLQRAIVGLVTELTGIEASPVGIDGCGLPVMRGTLRGLARGFATLTTQPRFAEVVAAMSRFPALVADNERPDGRIGAWWGGPLKVGAQGLIAAGRHGIGFAVKAHDGSSSVAAVGMMEAIRQLGLLPTFAQDALADVAAPPVLGGGEPVGATTVLPADDEA
jgi:L-asparaginase II